MKSKVIKFLDMYRVNSYCFVFISDRLLVFTDTTITKLLFID
ncbi:hypothetical protein Desgi_1039 [Desulfoscipio gibsoniae DSM 7213]|uniref:Uncharacterized protein n=1 Tax=Desulfoscipio gibsoniae DSM 7213 TaxID=767817 RepID=R4KLR7_9FIRM|nr:hypothetical protein Desgi_1039 [Desulfoscipio gibsoniae DSM 7213]